VASHLLLLLLVSAHDEAPKASADQPHAALVSGEANQLNMVLVAA
jgi:hypothetical protein